MTFFGASSPRSSGGSRDALTAERMAALFDRGRPADFVGVYLALRDDGYTRERLVELLREHDGGWDPLCLAGVLAELPHIPDAEFTAYGLDAIQIAMMRARFADWYRALLRTAFAGDGRV